MRVLFACGGSGGHITPAIAMAEILQKHFPETECAFVGNENGMERRIALEGGYPFFPIKIEGLHRSLSFRNLRTLFLAARAPLRAKQIIKEYQPSLVIGTGGYVSYPMIPAACKLGILTVLYEPNAIPGLSVRMTEKHASMILLQFDACASKLKYREKAHVIGAPLRLSFTGIKRREARARLGLPEQDFIVLCFGGSLGAECISTAATQSFAPLREQGITLIHGTGKRLFEQLSISYPEEAKEKHLLPYIDDMPAYMAAANVIVCRAGAITLAELAKLGRASLLIPSPYVAENHQEKNALLYEKKGAALLIKESELSAECLTERILFLKHNPSLLLRMERNASSICNRNAEECFVAAIKSLSKQSAKK